MPMLASRHGRAMPMLASDGRPLKRSNAHAHVAARPQTGRTLTPVARPWPDPNAHARGGFDRRLSGRRGAARGANLTLPTEGRTGHSGRTPASLENPKGRIF